jgi:hypothetical protein
MDRASWRFAMRREKRTRRFALILAVAFFAAVAAARSADAAHTQVSFGFFHSGLSPHGRWHMSASFGQVWQPRVYAVGWNPYYDGHWVYTDYGWTWVSDYAWGAIPYHYGTWVIEPAFGWVWVPGYVWAPSWVVFRTGPSYVGWAPVPPSFSVGMSFSFRDYDADRFVFVRSRDFLAPRIHGRALPLPRSRAIFRDTTIVNNIKIENNVVVNRGPDVRMIERVARTSVERQPLERVPKVTPTGRATRDALRVDASQARKGGRVRVVEPAAAGEKGSPRDRAPAVERSPQQQPRKERPAASPRPSERKVAPAEPRGAPDPQSRPEPTRERERKAGRSETDDSAGQPTAPLQKQRGAPKRSGPKPHDSR